MLKKNKTVQKMTCLFLVLFVSNLLMQVREVRGSMEVPAVSVRD
jgi:hypothetical protein